MSNFWNMGFKFRLSQVLDYGIFDNFVVETSSNATSEKNQTVKINGLVTMDELQLLTDYFIDWTPNINKIVGTTINGKIYGCVIISLSFNVMHKNNLKQEDIENKKFWKAHIVLSYDKIEYFIN
jgi:hypothetical protein